MGEQIGAIRGGVVWGAIAFGVALAVMVGVRLDQAALTVLVGVACGVGASIPTGVLVVLLLRRRDQVGKRRRADVNMQTMPAQPPVVVIAPPAAAQLPAPMSWPGAYSAPAPAQREFAVIGEEEITDGFDYWQANQ